MLQVLSLDMSAKFRFPMLCVLLSKEDTQLSNLCDFQQDMLMNMRQRIPLESRQFFLPIKDTIYYIMS